MSKQCSFSLALPVQRVQLGRVRFDTAVPPNHPVDLTLTYLSYHDYVSINGAIIYGYSIVAL
jgi:hypothetical protein